jgi:hypothetical protein
MADGKTTNLFVPEPLRSRIVAQAEADKRLYKPELLVLLEEAVDKREKKAAPRTAQPSDM